MILLTEHLKRQVLSMMRDLTRTADVVLMYRVRDRLQESTLSMLKNLSTRERLTTASVTRRGWRA